jgi:integrase
VNQKEDNAMNTDPTNTNSALPSAAMRALASELGRPVEEIFALIKAPPAPTVSEHSRKFLALQTPATRRTYATHINRLAVGVGPICDQHCEVCMDRAAGFVCRCGCSLCVKSRLTVEAQGPEPVSLDSYSAEHADSLSKIAKRIAVKSGILDNQARAERGLTRKPADGHNAAETAVHALRSLYGNASKYLGGENPGLEVKRPRRGRGTRRPLQPFELLELQHVTATGGDDPRLDELLFDFGIATGARRQGAHDLVVGRIYPVKQMIGLIEKYEHEMMAPVSRQLIDRLRDHAVTRGGPQCDPTSPMYRPNAPVFWRRDGRGFAPVTSRRFDTLHLRWQKTLPFANEERVGYHHLRHTMSAIIESRYGANYKARYLRHTVTDVTGTYGACTEEQLATAMADLLGFEHPLAEGRQRRRDAVMRRFGLSA